MPSIKEARDRTFKHPISMDGRLDQRIWTEACKTEKMYQQKAPSPRQYVTVLGGKDVADIHLMQKRLEKCSADFIWRTQDAGVPSPVSVTAAIQPEVCPMAELAMGIGDAETSFLRRRPDEDPNPRRAVPAQFPTMASWQMGGDPAYWRSDALDRWKAQQQADVLKMPAYAKPLPRVEATISGPHARSVRAWRNSEVPLSMWEGGERGDALEKANKQAKSLALDRSKLQLKQLMKSTLKVSASVPSPERAKWFER